jgi:large subunit ribosomal protein L21
MYAVIQEGSRQIRVSEGDRVLLDRAAESGSTIEFPAIFYADGQDVRVGAPTLADVKVLVDVADPIRGPKVQVMKFRRRKSFHRNRGHRQRYTPGVVKKIVVG